MEKGLAIVSIISTILIIAICSLGFSNMRREITELNSRIIELEAFEKVQREYNERVVSTMEKIVGIKGGRK